MLMTALVPLLLWKLTPDAWHFYLLLLGGVLVLTAVIMLIRYVIREHNDDLSVPSRSDYLWQSDWTVPRYSRPLLTYLKIAGWKVQAAQASGSDRLLLGLQRERHRIAMLCLRPGRAASSDDLAELEAMRQRQGTLVSVLMTDRTPRDTAPGAPIVLGYNTFPDLADVLDGGTEEERRSAAARTEAAA